MPRPLRTRKLVSAPATRARPTADPAASAKKAATKTPPAAPSTRARPSLPTEAGPSEPAGPRKTRSKGAVSVAAEPKTLPAKSKGKAPSTRLSALAITTILRSPSPAPSKSPSCVPETPPPLSQRSATPSSNAENRTPPRSSPPADDQSTPKPSRADGVIVDFLSDAGYTPPPPRRPNANSAERPRLQDLEPTTLEPLPGDDDFPEPPGSPTPRRMRSAAAIIYEEDEDEENEPPELPSPTGKGFLVPGDEEPFIIYSDPKSAPAKENTIPLTGTQAPPLSSSPPRKRGSSEAGFDLDSPNRQHHASEDEDDDATPVPEPTKRRRKRTAATAATGKSSKSTTALPTAELRSLMPRRRARALAARKRNAMDEDEFDVPSTSSPPPPRSSPEPADSDEDELASHPAPRRRAGRPRAAKATTSPRIGRKTVVMPKNARKTAEAWSRPLGGSAAAAGAVAAAAGKKKTYSRKPLPEEVGAQDSEEEIEGESEGEGQGRGDRGDSDLTTPPPTSTPASADTLELADGMVRADGQRKLRKLADKFRQVDAWALEFEDVSQRSLEEGGSSDSAKR